MKPFKEWKEETKLNLLRFWVSGMVCWLFAMSPLAGADQPNLTFAFMQLFIWLAIGLFLAHVLVINPIARLMFNVKYFDRFKKNLFLRVGYNMLLFFAMAFLVLMIALTYLFVNRFIFPRPAGESMAIQVEPFLFMVFFAIHFLLWNFIYRQVLRLIKHLTKRNTQKPNIELNQNNHL
jgi:hypothetical protein